MRLVKLVEWGFYVLSASKAIFRARTYNCNLFSLVMMMNETRRKPTTGRQSPSLFDKWHGIFYMPSRIDEAGHTKAFNYPVAEHWGESQRTKWSLVGFEPTSAHTYESEIQRSTTYATQTPRRLCGDFKTTINPVLLVDKYPLPRIVDIFANLSGGVKFSKVDLTDAFLQMEVEEQSRKYLTINTQRGLYEYTRLPFGVALEWLRRQSGSEPWTRFLVEFPEPNASLIIFW